MSHEAPRSPCCGDVRAMPALPSTDSTRSLQWWCCKCPLARAGLRVGVSVIFDAVRGERDATAHMLQWSKDAGAVVACSLLRLCFLGGRQRSNEGEATALRPPPSRPSAAHNTNLVAAVVCTSARSAAMAAPRLPCRPGVVQAAIPAIPALFFPSFFSFGLYVMTLKRE